MQAGEVRFGELWEGEAGLCLPWKMRTQGGDKTDWGEYKGNRATPSGPHRHFPPEVYTNFFLPNY